MNDERTHILEYLKNGIHLDGRKLDGYRKVSLEYGISKNAEGSARVKMGGTEVLAGVKLSVEQPYPDTPEAGCFMVGAELLPLSSPEFESGPPGIQAIELARVVDRGIRESKAIDMKKLCIKKGEKVWTVVVDIVTVNDEGNLFDASALAVLAALKDTRFPAYEKEEIDYKKKTDKKLPLTKEPIAITVLKIGDVFIVDPLPDEEAVVDARLTVTTTKDGNICALQKGGDYPVTIQDVEKMVDIGMKKAEEFRKLL